MKTDVSSTTSSSSVCRRYRTCGSAGEIIPHRAAGPEQKIVAHAARKLISKFIGAIGQTGPCQRWDGIDHDPELSFRGIHLAKTLLDNIALLRCRSESLPLSGHGGRTRERLAHG